MKRTLNNPTVLVTGSCGYIGSELVLHLLSLGYNVIGIDNLRYHNPQTALFPYYFHENPNSGTYEFYCGNVRHNANYRHLAARADAVIPLAALVGLTVCQNNEVEATEVNYESIMNLAGILRENQYVIFPNTNSFYGDASGREICDENTPGNPLSHYANTKLAAEKYLLRAHENTTVLRLATVFGTSPRTRLDLLVNDLAYQAYFTGKLTLYEPHVRRNFVHVSDVVQAMSKLIDLRLNKRREDLAGVFNFGNDHLNMTKGELFRQIAGFFNTDVEEVEGSDVDKRNYNVSSKKLYDRTGIEATAGILDGLHQLHEWFHLLPKKEEVRQQIIKYNRNA